MKYRVTMNKLTNISLILILLATTLSCQTSELDYLIKKATIVDGTGSPKYIADVGINGRGIQAC